jgi:hypothetical protein
LEEFSEFWEFFEGDVHTNKDLADIDRHRHLRACLSGEASNLLIGIPVDAKHYEQATDALKTNMVKKTVSLII